MKKFYILIIFFILTPVATEAHIIISEVMYNLEGSDVGREWIEICNNGEEKINLKDWKLVENDKNHNISLIDGKSKNFLIPPNLCAVVIVNKKEINNFYNDNPDFSGILFYSAFSSLNNSGEKISIKDTDLNNIDTINYSSDWGANGDGNSLQLINGKWLASTPTIGFLNNSSTQNLSSEVQKNKSETTSPLSLSQELNLMKKNIFVNAGGDKKVIVGADTLFKASAFGKENIPLKNANYVWSMGDGSRKKGQSVLYTYQYPGDYIVILEVTSSEYSANDRIIVSALPADIIISKVNKEKGFVELQNNSNYELNLSWWHLHSGKQDFIIPKNTIILPNKKLKFSSIVTGLSLDNLSQIYLFYPNGKIVFHYSVDKSNFEKKITPIISKAPLAVPVFKETPLKTNFIKKKTEKQTAMISNLELNNGNDFFNKWVFFLGGIMLFSVGGVFLARKYDNEANNFNQSELKPEDFKMID